MSKHYFGTDGIRGKVGDSLITPEFALKLGYAAGCVFQSHWNKSTKPKVLIGKDTRISGYLIESALESGFAAAGVDVALLGPIPTPAIAYLTRTFHACAGVVVSASHNPYYDNGIKFFSEHGRKLDDDLEAQIELQLEKPIVVVDSAAIGKAKRVEDAKGRYIEFCKSTLSSRLDLSHLTIVLDCANGATYQVAPSVFRELGAQVIPLSVDPNGLNINENCGSTSPNQLSAHVRQHQANVGIAFDGDGDRVIMVDGQGNLLDGDAILYLIAVGRQYQQQPIEGVVGTVMTNIGTENAIKALGIAFARANVGDRHVMETLVANGWQLGGESSGHIICLDKLTTGDGIIAALQVLETLLITGKTINQLLANYQLYPLKLENIAVKDKHRIMSDKTLQQTITDTNQQLGNEGRVLIRASGTEEKIRVMVEATQEKTVTETLAVLVNQIKRMENP
ncbi:phosphoglucosamine mutase [Ostreibacterium oceani]|uniref:Phosphoglucosamine mutase n=1 Tax=Ostreibacterium oceani TaxID=2654998 RepID=A0A6N7EQL3_9GAMM|nr:phosphoglucosamine mutase [Ostreibacterium oceani]MPV85144.1 phosphoglucosamine mutase [Ostreibacterium oceani]